MKTLIDYQRYLSSIYQPLSAIGIANDLGAQLDSAFSRLDRLEQLTIRRVNHLANDNAVSVEEVDEWGTFLSEVEKVHAFLLKNYGRLLIKFGLKMQEKCIQPKHVVINI